MGSPDFNEAANSGSSDSENQPIIRPLLPLGFLWLIAIAALGFMVLQRSVPQQLLLLDPSNIKGAPWYLGLLWGIEIVGWTTAVAASYLGSRICVWGNRLGASRMLRNGAVLSSLLLWNQLTRIDVIPGVVESAPIIRIICLLLVLFWFHTSNEELTRTRFELLLAAVTALGLGACLETVGLTSLGIAEQRLLLATSTLSFLGVLAWAQYFLLTVHDITRSIVVQLQRKPAQPNPAEPTEPKSPETEQREVSQQTARL